ncbi:hypothetical protein LSM04_005615 [Trypanosoma melophagium]|uniref:uncharacterized protein n=1 Tax=Trypanosoma melophagium TaxID=715481 RepID=UPI003519F811|nr:hypothetical protein LSM04_005615 [Trypanosoma melophagium]
MTALGYRMPLLLSSFRWEANKHNAQLNEVDTDMDDFMMFDGDFQFLDEYFGEGGADVFDYIPENEAALLGHDKR